MPGSWICQCTKLTKAPGMLRCVHAVCVTLDHLYRLCTACATAATRIAIRIDTDDAPACMHGNHDRKETLCDFCSTTLPDWKGTLTPSCGSSAPAVMNVSTRRLTAGACVQPLCP